MRLTGPTLQTRFCRHLKMIRIERAAQLLSRVFAGPVAESRITYAKVYGADGQLIFCESSLYAVGADPCSPNSIPDYSHQLMILLIL